MVHLTFVLVIHSDAKRETLGGKPSVSFFLHNPGKEGGYIMATVQPASKAATLIIVHGNKYIDVYSSERHPVKIVNVPDMVSKEGELLIEELLTLRLPPYWSKVYSDGFLVDRDAIKDVSVSDLMVRDNNIALIRTMNSHIGNYHSSGNLAPAGNVVPS